MDTIASARVPVEVKKQGDQKLKLLGSNTTELINAAYRYLLASGTLPEVVQSVAESSKREFSADQKAAFTKFLVATTLEAPPEWGRKTYDELREEAMAERYPEYFGDVQ